MNKSGMGVGSASIMLIFAVLCLTIFSLISLSVAGNDKALVDIESRLVAEYYDADALAESILAEILAADVIPSTVQGVNIETDWDWDLGAETASFYCPMSKEKQLYVKVAITEDSYDILSWRMWDIGDWVINENINVWLGEDEW